MNEIVLLPGATPLADWCAIYRGARRAPAVRDAWTRCVPAPPRSNASSPSGLPGLRHQHRLRQARQRAHRREGPRHAAEEPRVLACGRSRRADAGARHPADDGAQAGKPGAGRLGHQAADPGVARGDARADVVPLVPAQGSVGASGDLAPLAHMTAAMIGVGEAFVQGVCRPAAGARRGRAGADRARAQGRAGAAQRHAVLHRLCAGRVVRGRGAVSRRARHRRAGHRCRARLATRRSMRASIGCAVTTARSNRPKRCAPCSTAAPSVPRIESATSGSRIPIACAASRRSWARAWTCCATSADMLLDRSQRRVGQPADLQRGGRGLVRRQLPCGAGGVCGRHARARGV